MKDFKKEFPVLAKYNYLNTASCGLLSRSLVDWRRSHDLNLMENGSVFRDKHRPHIQQIRTAVGRFLKTSEDEIALVPNFSFGMNMVTEALPKKLKILLLESDYPSVNWAIENRDFELCFAKVDDNFEENIEATVARHRPDVFVFSIVQYLTGVRMDFNFLKQLKAYHPNLILIGDGTQFLGTTDFNFSESPLDIMAASNYKWMLSGYGNAILIIKEAMREQLSPKTIGFNSAEAAFSRRDEIEFMRRFEPGHQDTLNFGSLEQSILNFEALGMAHVETKITELSKRAKSRFTEEGLLPTMITAREQHSNIFNLKGDEKLFQKLKENKIICSLRGGGIRVGFHFYNSEEDLEKLLKVLKS